MSLKGLARTSVLFIIKIVLYIAAIAVLVSLLTIEPFLVAHKIDSLLIIVSLVLLVTLIVMGSIQFYRQAAMLTEIASQAKSHFFAAVSHEIRTPMHGVLGTLELLADTSLTFEQQNYLATAQASGDALLSIINDILDLTKIEAGKLSLNALPFQVLNLVEGVTELLAARAYVKLIEIGCLVDKHIPSLLVGDAGRIRQVLVNLIGNAIKFTSNGGVIIEVELLNQNDHQTQIKFQVTDTGVGIPKEEINKLFEEFSQLDFLNKNKYGGTGLGLAVSQRLVHLMGGEIGVESNVGKGSKFWFTLTLKNASQVKEWSTPFKLKGYRVLLADSSEIGDYIITQQLQYLSVEVISFKSHRALLQHFSQVNPQLNYQAIIFSQRMMNLSVEEFVSTIKNNQYLSGIRLIMTTIQGTHAFDLSHQKLGIYSILKKPIRMIKLAELIDNTDLPVLEALPQPLEADKARKNLFVSKQKVLIVDDSHTNRLILGTILKNFGLEVEETASGNEALQAAQTHHYDLIMLDLIMPDINGFTVAEKIRNLSGKNQHTPMIATTANVMEKDINRCLQAGMNDYIGKPFNKKELLEMLKKWLQEEKEQRQEHLTIIDEQIDHPALDIQVLKQLEIDMGCEALIQALHTFIDEAKTRGQQIPIALNNHDLTQLHIESHSLKSSAQMFGAQQLYKLARATEIACNEANSNKAIQLGKALAAIVPITVHSLQDYVHEITKQ